MSCMQLIMHREKSGNMTKKRMYGSHWGACLKRQLQ
uniref:Uncharacterized protein n=1 Tax=Rhizophora mucronata TaxID=61149 RepID=A0A2P2PMG4_RHIMU